ncbi:MAG TPA: hypothetical protein VEK79_22730 [Thermoanaerobaculia bacterium]|nr:hypothetical protein [Thermoanaerobaculia bacterium]
MRKALRFVLLAVAVFAMPATNALDMHCFSGKYGYSLKHGWTCEFYPGGGDCILCYAAITVEG